MRLGNIFFGICSWQYTRPNIVADFLVASELGIAPTKHNTNKGSKFPAHAQCHYLY